MQEPAFNFRNLSYATAAAFSFAGLSTITPQIIFKVFGRSGTASPFTHDAVQLLGAANLTIAGAALAVASTKDPNTRRRFSKCVAGAIQGLLLSAAVDLYIVSQQSTRDFGNQWKVPHLLFASATSVLFSALHASIALSGE